MTSELQPAPARRYTWEPFKEGHTLSTKHGAYSERFVGPLAEQVVADLLAVAAEDGSSVDYLADVTYRPAIEAWARAEVRARLVSDWLDDHGGDLFDETDDEGRTREGVVRSAARLLDRLESSAVTHREKLGLDPRSRAALGRDVAQAAAARRAATSHSLADVEAEIARLEAEVGGAS